MPCDDPDAQGRGHLEAAVDLLIAEPVVEAEVVCVQADAGIVELATNGFEVVRGTVSRQFRSSSRRFVPVVQRPWGALSSSPEFPQPSAAVHVDGKLSRARRGLRIIHIQ